MALPVGAQAPDFSLKTKSGDELKDVKLSDLKGKTFILISFPMAFTPVCTKQMQSTSEAIEELRKDGAEVYGVSVDNPYAQEAWAKQENINVPLLSDMEKKLIKEYGIAEVSELGETAARSAIVIDKEGKVIYSEQTEIDKLPDLEKVKEAAKN